MAIIFITHDLRVAAQVSDYIAVMEKGIIVEFGTAYNVFNKPKHNYTKMLLEAAPGKDWHPPRLDPEEAAKIAKSLETINQFFYIYNISLIDFIKEFLIPVSNAE